MEAGRWERAWMTWLRLKAGSLVHWLAITALRLGWGVGCGQRLELSLRRDGVDGIEVKLKLKDVPHGR